MNSDPENALTDAAAHAPSATGIRRGRNNLVTMGSAAVLAIYAAGYLRTRAAAQAIEDEANSRHARAVSTPTPLPLDSLRWDSVATISTPPLVEAREVPPAKATESANVARGVSTQDVNGGEVRKGTPF